jgi:WD40 repeat protein
LSDDGQSLVVWWRCRYAANTSGCVIGDQPGGIDVYDTETGERRERFLTQTHGFETSGALSPDGQIVTGYLGGLVVVSTISTAVAAAEETIVPAHFGSVHLIEFGPDGLIITAGNDQKIRFWSSDLDNQVAPPLVNQGKIRAIGAGITGITVTRSGGQMIRFDGVYSREALPIVEALVASPSPVFHLSSDTPWWVSSPVPDQTVLRLRRLDSDEQRDIDMSSVHPTGWIFPHFSSDGEWVRTYDRDPTSGVIGLWEVAGDRRTAVHLGPIWAQLGITDEAPNIRTSPARGGERLFVATQRSDGAWVAVWVDVASEQIVAGPLEISEGNRPRILHDNSVVVGGPGPLMLLPPGLDEQPLILDGVNGLIPLHQDEASGLVLLGGDDGDVALFDPGSGEVEYLVGAAGTALAGAFSPSGDRIAIVSNTYAVQLFDAATGQPLGGRMVAGAGTEIFANGLAWSADGRGVWSIAAPGPVRYAAHPASWRDAACGIAGRELTPEEWRSFVSEDEPQVSACS